MIKYVVLPATSKTAILKGNKKSGELSYYIHFCISINFCNTISFHSMCTFAGNIWAYFGFVLYLSSQSFVVDF